MARRVFSALEYDSADAVIGRREAKRDPRVIQQYVKQRGTTVSTDMLRRDLSGRPFIAWDGEGYNDSDGVHHYMLFGASTGDAIQGASLDTKACLDLLLMVERMNPDVFHVIFAGNYDVNMMLKDVDRVSLEQLKRRGYCKWNGYTIGYIKGKMFRVKKNGVSITLYDVFTFFGCSFVKALEQYIGADDEDVTRIKSGKAERANFSYDDVDDVRQYFQAELRYLVRLCNKLRDYLHVAGIRISKWHGPGAVASAVLRTRGFSRLSLPEHVSEAGQYAYTGGRFEQFRIGAHYGPVWQYDIRSAYPAAIATLPSISGVWVDNPRPKLDNIKDFSLYYVSYGSKHYAAPHPFAWRHRNGAVFYPPNHGGTWVWGVELRSALHYAPGDVYVHRSIDYVEDGTRPFAWIADMYDRRAEWKENGNPAELALKLAMNSIYGKLAQQVGWRMTAAGPKLPKFHQLEYAGYITAFARSGLYGAMMQKPHAIVAVETDAVYSTEPLALDIGTGLGQWEEKRFDGIMYVQSGMYFAREGTEWKHRTRGFGRGDIGVDTITDWLSGIWTTDDAYRSKLSVAQTRFKTMGTSLGKAEWRRWVTADRDIHAGVPGGKREHYGAMCRACQGRTGSMGDCLHDMVPALSLPNVDYRTESTKYPLEWLGDPKSEWQGDDDDIWQEDVYD